MQEQVLKHQEWKYSKMSYQVYQNLPLQYCLWHSVLQFSDHCLKSAVFIASCSVANVCVPYGSTPMKTSFNLSALIRSTKPDSGHPYLGCYIVLQISVQYYCQFITVNWNKKQFKKKSQCNVIKMNL